MKTITLNGQLYKYVSDNVITPIASAPVSTEPYVGMPATIVLFSDTIAAVITKVNAKSVIVQRVATGPERRINDAAEPFPVIASEGILTEVNGNPERFSKRGERYAAGSIGLILGKSVSKTDYRY